jgi:hypothetical protein
MPLQQTDIQREREEFQLVYTVSRIVIHKSSVNCTSDDYVFLFLSSEVWYSHEIVLRMWMSFFKGVGQKERLRTAALQYSCMNKYCEE